MRALLLTITTGLCSGCASVEASRATRTHTTVTVHWQASDTRVEAECRRRAGSGASLGPHRLGGCAGVRGDRCEIIAVQPASFLDTARLSILGHELWHCLGATHR
jgi:hypothetical protein